MPEMLTTHDMPEERAEQVAARIFERKEMAQMTDEEHKQLQIDELVQLNRIKHRIDIQLAIAAAQLLVMAGLTLSTLRG